MNKVASLDEVVIRKAVLSDVERIVRLSNAGGPDGQPKQSLPDVLPDGYFESFRRIDKDPNQTLMVAELEKNIVGTFHLTFLTYLAGEGREDCQIEAVHVDFYLARARDRFSHDDMGNKRR